MYLTDQELAERFRVKRPGLELIAIEDAAVPVTVLNISILAQQKKHISLLEEFLLRAIDAGVRSVDEISTYLGIPSNLVEPALVSQLAAHNVVYDSRRRHATLTTSGVREAQELSTVIPVETEVPIAFDRAIWKPTEYKTRDLIRRGEAESLGKLLIPAKYSTRIGTSDVCARDIQKLVRTERADDRYQVLDIMRVRRSRNAYLPVKMLVFSDNVEPEPELLFVVDGAESADHQAEIAAHGGPDILDVSVRNQSGGAGLESNNPLGSDSLSPPIDVHGRAANIIRTLSAYEHGIELQRALLDVNSRLLITSPSIFRAVVDRQFLADMERRLLQGVHVAIGYGFGSDNRESDSDAILHLSNLQKRYSDQFALFRVPDCRLNYLVRDNVTIESTFEWLSFRGARGRPYGIDKGVVLNGKEYSDALHSRFLAGISASD